MFGLDDRQLRTLVWAGAAVVMAAFDGSVLILALPAIAHDFQAQVPELTNLGSVLAVGTLGALPLATLADRFGRRRLIAVGVAGFSLANFASSFAQSLEALALLRLVAVGFESLVASVATALIVEEAPRARRGQAVSVLALLGGAGTGITVIAYPAIAPHWRELFLVGGVGVALAPLIWSRLPEGRAWSHVTVSGSALRLLLRPEWRLRLFLMAAVSALLAALLQPAGLLFTVFASDALRMGAVAISALIVVSGIAGAVSYLAGGYLTDRFGRRALASVLTAGTSVAASLSFVTGTVGFVVGNVIWSAIASAATPVFGAWSAELFPTRARATAEAAKALAWAIGSIGGLQAVGLLSISLGLGWAIVVMGAAALAGAAVVLLLPETRGMALPD